MSQASVAEMIDNMRKVALYYQEIIKLLLHNKNENTILNFLDSKIQQEVTSKIIYQTMTQPEKFINLNLQYLNNCCSLIENSIEKFLNKDLPPEDERSNNIEVNINRVNMNGVSISSVFTKDYRFKDPAWQQNIYFDFIKQYYLLSSDWLKQTINKYDLDSEGRRYLEFIVRQFIDALSPGNFLLGNPQVIQETISSGMKNIVQGLSNFLTDLRKSIGVLGISTTDNSYFTLGQNLATTEGKVIYQNDIMQLIYYKPEIKAYDIPIFIIPPWINKYYILDLSPGNSMIKWLVENNYCVFLVSWVNPGKELADKDFEDYLQEGILEPCRYIKENLGYNQVNAVGYCIGGTLLATALAYCQAKKLTYFASSSFFTTLIDFANPGEIGAFINKATISLIKQEVKKQGYLDGRYLANSFSLIRANDLIWSFFINNYLLGKAPAAFDILYWNADATNLPAKMCLYYLQNMYINNLLKEPGALKMLGVKIDLTKVTVPSFSLAAKADHIALWQSVYSGYQILGANTQPEGSDKTFCLTEAGHIAGVINPIDSNKYSHLLGQNLNLEPAAWLALAQQHEGSWWKSWHKWLIVRSGKLTNSAEQKMIKEETSLETGQAAAGNKNYTKNIGKKIGKKTGKKNAKKEYPNWHDIPALEAAPGSYVQKRI